MAPILLPFSLITKSPALDRRDELKVSERTLDAELKRTTDSLFFLATSDVSSLRGLRQAAVGDVPRSNFRGSSEQGFEDAGDEEREEEGQLEEKSTRRGSLAGDSRDDDGHDTSSASLEISIAQSRIDSVDDDGRLAGGGRWEKRDEGLSVEDVDG